MVLRLISLAQTLAAMFVIQLSMEAASGQGHAKGTISATQLCYTRFLATAPTFISAAWRGMFSYIGVVTGASNTFSLNSPTNPKKTILLVPQNSLLSVKSSSQFGTK